MAEDRSELEERRDELARSLPGLSETRAKTYRSNSDARALDRAGVKSERPEELQRLEEAEVAADAAVRDAQREVREIDAELAARPRRRVGARIAGVVRGRRSNE